MFPTGSVVHNREWCYNKEYETQAVVVDVRFKSNISILVNRNTACRTIRIVDDQGTCHGELDLAINCTAPKVEAIPRAKPILRYNQMQRKTQPYV